MNSNTFLLLVLVAALGGCVGYASRQECGVFNGSRASCAFHDDVSHQLGRSGRWGS